MFKKTFVLILLLSAALPMGYAWDAIGLNITPAQGWVQKWNKNCTQTAIMYTYKDGEYNCDHLWYDIVWINGEIADYIEVYEMTIYLPETKHDLTSTIVYFRCCYCDWCIGKDLWGCTAGIWYYTT